MQFCNDSREANSTSMEADKKGVALTALRSWFKPEQCPVTGRAFFMWIEHYEKGWVPTYGGPYDSYTLAERDEEGNFFCERYDHDAGGWLLNQVEGIGLRLIDDQREDYEYGTLQAAQSRHAEEREALVRKCAEICHEYGQAYGGIYTPYDIGVYNASMKMKAKILALLPQDTK